MDLKDLILKSLNLLISLQKITDMNNAPDKINIQRERESNIFTERHIKMTKVGKNKAKKLLRKDSQKKIGFSIIEGMLNIKNISST